MTSRDAMLLSTLGVDLKHPNKTNQMSAEEWLDTPVIFGVDVMSHVCGYGLRFVQNHAEELGGRKVGGRWLFSKPVVAQLLGLTL